MNIHNLNVGSKINGTYSGEFFIGTIYHMRPNTLNYKQTLLFITLDHPIKVYTEWRDSLLIYARADGSTASPGVEIWGIEYPGITKTVGYSMADRFEAVETDPKFAVKLYREMRAQSEGRAKAVRDMYIQWNSRKQELLVREFLFQDACNTLIRRYTELL